MANVKDQFDDSICKQFCQEVGDGYVSEKCPDNCCKKHHYKKAPPGWASASKSREDAIDQFSFGKRGEEKIKETCHCNDSDGEECECPEPADLQVPILP